MMSGSVIRKSDEVLEKLVKAVESRHSGQAKRDPESRIFGQLWIPAFAGMTACAITHGDKSS
jgi:hypothetical protein